jgi:hypothetical protein
MVQLENQVDAGTEVSDEEPGRLEAVLSRLRSAVPSINEEVVFAYQNPEETRQTEASDEAGDKQNND